KAQEERASLEQRPEPGHRKRASHKQAYHLGPRRKGAWRLKDAIHRSIDPDRDSERERSDYDRADCLGRRKMRRPLQIALAELSEVLHRTDTAGKKKEVREILHKRGSRCPA